MVSAYQTQLKTLTINKLTYIVILVSAMIAISGCSTGIEGTRRVTPNRDDRRLLQQTPEEFFISNVHADSLGMWKPGKRFLVTDNKAALIYEISDKNGMRLHDDSLAGQTIFFRDVADYTAPDGSTAIKINFTHPASGKTISYNTNRPAVKAASIDWNNLPMLVDLDLVESFRSLLSGKTLWIKTPLWYSENGEPITGTKFIPVEILDVVPGNAIFPLNVKFRSDDAVAFIPMNASDKSSSFVSRVFPSLFYLSDPKESYPAITPETWSLICHGRLAIGMTKTECKLAVGNPKEVEHGHNWDVLIDYWKYENGMFLVFIDDKLTEFKQ